jgi:hypothetical protein
MRAGLRTGFSADVIMVTPAVTLIGPRADHGAALQEGNGLIGLALTPPAVRPDVH